MKRSLLIALGVMLGVGCGASKPQLKVVGVSPAKAHRVEGQDKVLLVFVEVVNPTGRALRLSRFRYSVKASRWFDSDGDMNLSRAIRPHARVVLELEVPYSPPADAATDAVPYTLEGKLYARENRRERSWEVRTSGRIVPIRTAQTRVIRYRTAASR